MRQTELAERVGVSRHTIMSIEKADSPDAWGRRVVGYKYPDLLADELDYMLLSGSDRIGALDFQVSSTEYQPRGIDHPGLNELLEAASLSVNGYGNGLS